MRTPDFLVVGTARAGTTSLHSYLRQHPGIFLPAVKEPCFFIFENAEQKYVKGRFAFATRDFHAYEKLFERADPNQKTGEMSTPYLYLHQQAIANIKKHFRDYRKIKIVILLRNPVDRAFSQYKWRVRDGREPLTFEAAIKAEQERKAKNYSFDYFYVDRGFYFEQVKDYMENFDHLHVVTYEEFKKDHKRVLSDLCRFLNVDEKTDFKEVKKQNESSVPRWKFLSRLMTVENPLKYKLWYLLPDSLRKGLRNKFSDLNSSKRKTLSLSNATKNALTDTYREDVLSLQKLLNRDLSHWLK